MDTLLLDIKTLIAAYDQEVWYLLYRYDHEFHDYAVTRHAISRFIELFTVEIVTPDRTEYRLLGYLHRGDLPAVILANSDQEWYHRGQRHRDNDLPALIYANDTYVWYQHGVKYRDNGLPMKVNASGDQFWYDNKGMGHRDGGLPAVIWASGIKAWFCHGYVCSPPDLGIAEMILDIKVLIASEDEQIWYMLYRFDLAFRDYAKSHIGRARFIELFTVKILNPHGTTYRLFGKTHRVNDLPAYICINGDRYWYTNDHLHRDNDLPAVIYANGAQYWYQHGQRHRDNDLPAVINANGTHYWYQRGRRHRDNGLPVVVLMQ